MQYQYLFHSGFGTSKTLSKCAQPYIEHYKGVGIGKAPPRWISINDKNKKYLDDTKLHYLKQKKKEL